MTSVRDTGALGRRSACVRLGGRSFPRPPYSDSSPAAQLDDAFRVWQINACKGLAVRGIRGRPIISASA